MFRPSSEQRRAVVCAHGFPGGCALSCLRAEPLARCHFVFHNPQNGPVAGMRAPTIARREVTDARAFLLERNPDNKLRTFFCLTPRYTAVKTQPQVHPAVRALHVQQQQQPARGRRPQPARLARRRVLVL